MVVTKITLDKNDEGALYNAHASSIFLSLYISHGICRIRIRIPFKGGIRVCLVFSELTAKEVFMKGKWKIAMAVTVIAALILVACGAMAVETEKKAKSPKQQAQQEKMKACNADAKTKGLKGDERKKFMSECLKASS